MGATVGSANLHHEPLVVRYLGLQDYQPIWQAMLEFTDGRNFRTLDEIWFVEHPSVFTQGQAGKAEHLLAPGDIPVIQVDRGGQVTYHGPGQSVVYFLLNLRRRGMGVRALVTAIEASVVATLATFDISSQPRADAPGVYVDSGAKICSLGLRVRKGCSLHGLALNVAMDLSPFSRINPCGLVGITVTDMASEQQKTSFEEVNTVLLEQICRHLTYNVQAELRGL